MFTSATQGWFFNKLRWYEIILFLVISISLLSPEFVLNKFYPKYNYLDINQIQNSQFDPKKKLELKLQDLVSMEKGISYLLLKKIHLRKVLP